MQGMQPWKARRQGERRTMALAPISRCKVAVVGLAMLAGGCASISTPLPDPKPTASTALSKQDQKKAVDELTQKRDTHEQDAEKQIESSQ
jgi:hypothetical protein